MRIRTWIILVLVFAGLLPITGFTWFTYKHSLTQEFADVKERHLLLAKNLSAALSRYERDVRATIQSVALSLESTGAAGSAKGLMNTLNIRSIALVDENTGVANANVSTEATKFPEILTSEIIEKAQSVAKNGRLFFSSVVPSEGTYNRMHVLGRRNNMLIVAEIDTQYFVTLGNQVAFGENGHAAIVDHDGNILAHPLESWVESAKNIAKVSPVQRMLNGETGVEQFYSPALNGDMIAGLTAVAGPGWGVMIPQPVSELRARAFNNIKPLLFGLVTAIVLSLLLFLFALRWFARPLENINEELRNQLENGRPSEVPPSKARTRIYELTRIVAAYNALVFTVEKSAQLLSAKALQDTVTSIGNRTYFNEKGQQQIDRRTALSKKGILILTDLDGFKEINDTRGHALGDSFLEAYAQDLYVSTKRFMDREFRGVPGDHPIIGRIGGDEFAILLPVPPSRDDLDHIGAQLLQELPSILEVDGVTIPCSVSAGGSVYPQHGATIETLLQHADVALYASKANGKSQFTLYDKKSDLGSKSEILSAVSLAIERDELVLEYQPKYCLTKGKVSGVEALLRWNHPRVGRVYPNSFLHAIQRTHVMVQLGEWVTARAIKDIGRLDALGHNLDVAINIGVEHFSHSNFIERLQDACFLQNFSPARLQLEITEDVMDWSQGELRKTVSALQQDGFKVAIDDFGKGYSNLSRMANISADVIKLDRSFISEAVTNPRIHTVMKSAVDMAHAMGASVVVEGVETLKEVKMAQEAGADALQGFYFSKALPVETLSHWLHSIHMSPQHQQVKKLAKILQEGVA